MYRIIADFTQSPGPIKPMNGLNNGPYMSRGVNNFESYKAIRSPFARNHDASFCAAYGGSHTVDILAVFPDFTADENDPASYDFVLTDEYIDSVEAAGTRMFYRLGNRIEHEIKKYGAIPPADFAKWARICEHIIRHETQGWANGFYRDMPYWEIWCEPDLGSKCWAGTFESFFEFYEIAARHLKKCFPGLHIGGPSVTLAKSSRHETSTPFLEKFFAYLTRNPDDPVPLDFFSYHRYGTDPRLISQNTVCARALLDRFGYTDTECILNEWNYVRGWAGEEFVYSHRTLAALKGAAFNTACMIEGQHSPLDHLMYYDARIDTCWNGLWERITMKPKKPYYSLYAFAELAGLGCEACSNVDCPDIFCLAAKNAGDTQGAVLFTRYRDEDCLDGSGIPEEDVKISFRLPKAPRGFTVTVSLLDSNHDLSPVETRTFDGDNGYIILPAGMYTTVLVTVKVR